MTVDLAFELASVEALVYRAPVATPVRTSFGTMRSRPCALVRAVSSEGVEGWGEIWCNFPAVGAEHRARLLADTVAPLATCRRWSSPREAFRTISGALEILAIQSGEPGPLAQAVAGLDVAIWDIVARRAGRPVYALFRDETVASVPAYASGLNPDRPELLAAARLADGHRAFKLKVGFGRERDLANLAAVREAIGAGSKLMIDANQGWMPEEAQAMVEAVSGFGLQWIEEPLRADQPPEAWRSLARLSATPLAAGENMRGDAFGRAIAEKALGVLQPDLGKWGGFSECVEVAREALAGGLRFCPHWLGGGIGLAASIHLLAAVGGDGMVEVDSNPNPLRDLIVPPLALANGEIAVPAGPGLGVVPDLAALESFAVAP